MKKLDCFPRNAHFEHIVTDDHSLLCVCVSSSVALSLKKKIKHHTNLKH